MENFRIFLSYTLLHVAKVILPPDLDELFPLKIPLWNNIKVSTYMELPWVSNYWELRLLVIEWYVQTHSLHMLMHLMCFTERKLDLLELWGHLQEHVGRITCHIWRWLKRRTHNYGFETNIRSPSHGLNVAWPIQTFPHQLRWYNWRKSNISREMEYTPYFHEKGRNIYPDSFIMWEMLWDLLSNWPPQSISTRWSRAGKIEVEVRSMPVNISLLAIFLFDA